MRAIRFQRFLDVAARLTIFGSRGKVGWTVGTAALFASKCIENMELAHNITHGQWDWMNDPEIHSSTWEWDMAGPSSQWRYSHNYRHHVFANVVGMDDDLGYGVLRVSRDQEWKQDYLFAPLRAVLLAVVFEWGIALHDLYAEQERHPTEEAKAEVKRVMVRKMGRQAAKDYLLFPALSGRRWRRTFMANLSANVLRNVWAFTVIVCRALRRRRREVHSLSRGERDEAGVVSATAAGERELRCRSRHGIHEWKPLLPDRAPPVPRSAQ